MRQVLINGIWETPPDNNVHGWLNEKVAVELGDLLNIKRYIRRFELIQAIKKSARSKPMYVKIVR